MTENLNFQAKLALEDKDKAIRMLNEDIKDLSEQLEDCKISLNMQEKRLEFKEATLKQQLGKINEKYQQAENERQKATE